MTPSGWSPHGGAAARDPLVEMIAGLRSSARGVIAALERAAPAVDGEAPGAPPGPEMLALLGLVQVCRRVDALADGLTDTTARVTDVAVTHVRSKGSLLR